MTNRIPAYIACVGVGYFGMIYLLGGLPWLVFVLGAFFLLWYHRKFF